MVRWSIKSAVGWVEVEHWLLFLMEPRFVFRGSVQHIMERVVDGPPVAVQRDIAGRRGDWQRPSSRLIWLLAVAKRGHRGGRILIPELCGGVRLRANRDLTVKATEGSWPGLKRTEENWSRSRANTGWLEDPVHI